MKLYRKVINELNEWKKSNVGLIVLGSRQVGKTYIIDQFLKENFKSYTHLNLYENVDAIESIINAKDINDFYLRYSLLCNGNFQKDSVIFIDEIQSYYTYISKNNINKYFDLMTMSKFIVQEGNHRIIFSGSLLRLEMNHIISNPEGYMYQITMYPLDFEEFLIANSINEEIINIVKESFNNLTEIPNYIHNKLISLFREYILVGGMPAAVDAYLTNKSFASASFAHKTIDTFIRNDITKYALDNEKLKIEEIYNLIPTELNRTSRRFIISDIPGHSKNANEQLSFAWLEKAGVAIRVHVADEPVIPLLASSQRNKLKLFHEDVGLLTYYLFDSQTKTLILNDATYINSGMLYENAVAQLLKAHGYENLYYYNNKKNGEVDFLIENNGEIIPIEVKSGKNYSRLCAIDKLLMIKNYTFNKAYVLYNENIKIEGKKIFLPIYLIDFIVHK